MSKNLPTKCRIYRSQGPLLLSRFITRGDTSVEACARAIGVGVRTLQRWLNGQARPHLGAAILIAAWTSDTVPAEAWLTDGEIAQWAALK